MHRFYWSLVDKPFRANFLKSCSNPEICQVRGHVPLRKEQLPKVSTTATESRKDNEVKIVCGPGEPEISCLHSRQAEKFKLQFKDLYKFYLLIKWEFGVLL